MNHLSLKESNLMEIVRTLHFNQINTRSTLAKQLGVTQAAITKLVNELMQYSLVSEEAVIAGKKGRPAIQLKFNGERILVLTGRINRDYISCAIYDLNGTLYEYSERKISSSTRANEAVAMFGDLGSSMLNKADRRVIGLGMALPGPFDARHGRIALMSGFPGWEYIDLQKELTDRLQLPVFLEHDANCGALAELWYGDDRTVENMVYIVGDRGVGAGIILGGRVYQGEQGFAGEIGHTTINCFGPKCECGNRGCLELYGSTRALEAAYRDMVFNAWQKNNSLEDEDTADLSAKDICALVLQGDEMACRAYKKTVAYLSIGAINLINLLNPEAVVFSDKITDGGPLFLEVAKNTLKEHLMPDVYQSLKISTSSLQYNALVADPMLLGTSVVVFEQIMTRSPQRLLSL